MTVTQKESLFHWNYFIALEHDLVECSRYVEFSQKNIHTYSIEFAHLLFASSSEVDVILKKMCKIIAPNQKVNSIHGYRPIVLNRFPQLKNEKVYVDRFGIIFKPWLKWQPDSSPFWWQNYNKVKHQRDEYFDKADLNSVLRSMGALLIVSVYYYYLDTLNKNNQTENIALNLRDITRTLSPDSELLTLNKAHYYDTLIGD
jgi:hypothetical protein